MTTFETPEPISVSLDFGVGDVRLVASESTETVVEVRPTDPTNEADVNAAKQTRVEYASGSLLVKGPKNWRHWTPRGGRESIDVEIQLPAGSRVSTDVGVATVRGVGRLGALDVKTGMGDVNFDDSGAAKIRTGFGQITVGRVEGDADVRTGSGRVDIASIEGALTVKNSNGDTRIGEVEGRAQLQNSNGAIEVDSARSDVTAKTACGDIRLGLLSEGTTEAKTAFGRIDIGILDGVAAWMDLSTGFGRVNNELNEAGHPAPGARTTEVRAHTAAGDINIHRVSTRDETSPTR